MSYRHSLPTSASTVGTTALVPPKVQSKGGYTLVTLPRIVKPHRDSVDGNRDRVTYQQSVTR